MFLRRKSRNQSQTQGEDLFFKDHYVFETKIEKSESIVNNTSFTLQKKIKVYSRTNLEEHCMALTKIHLKICSFYGSLTQKGSRPLPQIIKSSEHATLA